jgi:hypothetical protein
MEKSVNIETINLEKLKVACRQVISAEYTAHVDYDAFARGIVAQIERTVWSKKIGHEDIAYPADWWEAFKLRWAPRRFLRRWPVRYAHFDVSVYHTYPAFVVAERNPILRINHFQWTDKRPGDPD